VDIVVNEGVPLDVPIIFYGGGLTGHPVELFVWLETIDSSSKAYFAPGGWILFNDYSELSPIGQVSSMIEYAYVLWEAVPSVSNLPSELLLSICLDGVVDGKLLNGVNTEGSHCAQRKIIYQPCEGSGIYVYDNADNPVDEISESVEAGNSIYL